MRMVVLTHCIKVQGRYNNNKLKVLMFIFVFFKKRILFLKKRFSVQKIQASKMEYLTPEVYQALLIFEAQVPKHIDFCPYRE